jgi:holo-[acyl-carrier protein] synthase
MIYGIGIDIVKTDRIKSAVQKWGERFLRRVFTEDEIAYSHLKKEPYLSLSVRFAAKEALIKAVGANLPFAFTDIEVVKNGEGPPLIRVKGGIEAYFEQYSITKAHLSLSHEREFGVACVVLEAE